MRPSFLTLLFSVSLSFQSFQVFSQSNPVQANASLAEKVYLQLDSRVYTNDQTIWYKAIVARVASHTPTTLSGVLYVDLIGPEGQLVESKLLKLSNGTGDGFFDLDESYTPGRYLIRAYTEWNKNFDNDFLFKEYIDLFPSSKSNMEGPIASITMMEEQPGIFWLRARLNPLLIDSLHQKKLNLSLIIDGRKDSLSIKENSEGEYLLDYALPTGAKSDLLTLSIETKNLYRYTKTIALNENRLDLQFFPESGEMVHGLASKVGFKALDYSGKGKQVEGEIVDEEGKVLTAFKSNPLGMGSFFVWADSSKTYYAKLASSSEKDLSLKYRLPDPAASGHILSVAKTRKNITVIASSTSLQDTDSVFISVNCRGIEYFLIQDFLTEGKLAASLLAKGLPEGIISFTLMGADRKPLAERLYFNEQPRNRLNIKLSTYKARYNQREKTPLDIQVRDSEGQALKANLSILVMNNEQMGPLQDSRKNILTYFLLDSELRGEVEDPGYYFRKENEQRLADLDALLLTQGWRKYHYYKPISDTLLFQPEPALNVSGKVGGIFFRKMKKEGIGLTMMTFGKVPDVQAQVTDSLGRFHFDLNEEYGQDLNILIQSTSKWGNNRDYLLTLDEKQSPEISYNQVHSIVRPDSTVYALVEKHQQRKSIRDAFRLSSEDIELKEVVVEAYRMTPEREKVMQAYGKPDMVINGKDIKEKEKKWSYGLYSILKFNFPDIRIREIGGTHPSFKGNPFDARDKLEIDRGSFLYAEIIGGGNVTLVLVDGVPVRSNEYPLVPNIPPSEVMSVELLRNVKNFQKLYQEAFPNATLMDIPSFGSAIAIYTHGGNGIFAAKKAEGMFKTSIPVFSPWREFYAPSYEKLSTQDWIKPDLRTLIHWAPQINVDSTGNSSASFYNADETGKMRVVVEAIADNGKIGYQEIVYEVSKRDKANNSRPGKDKESGTLKKEPELESKAEKKGK